MKFYAEGDAKLIIVGNLCYRHNFGDGIKLLYRHTFRESIPMTPGIRDDIMALGCKALGYVAKKAPNFRSGLRKFGGHLLSHLV
jgi:hypothetical protein